jgi:hypothetical protein
MFHSLLETFAMYINCLGFCVPYTLINSYFIGCHSFCNYNILSMSPLHLWLT